MRGAVQRFVIVAALAAAVVLGGCGDDSSSGPGPDVGDHWHVAYAMEVCGEVQEPPQDRGADALGIHTHGDGLIHIHPFVGEGTGANANLGAFLDQIGAQVSADGIELAGESFPVADGCDGEDAVVRVAQWDSALDAANGAPPDRIVDPDVDDIVLEPDLGAITVSLGPEDAPISSPPSSNQICALAAADGATSHEACASTPTGNTAPTSTTAPG